MVLMDQPLTGVNNRWRTSRKIGDSESPELLNVTLEDQARPSKRDGYLEVESGHAVFSSGALRGSLFAELDVGVASRLMVVGFPGGKTYRTHSPDGPEWQEALVTEDATGTVSRSLDVTTDRAKCVQGNDLLWLLTPGTGTTIHVMDTTGEWVDCGSAKTSPPVNAADGVYMLSRLWLVGGTRLYWSKLLPTRADLVPDATAFDTVDNADGSVAGFIELSPEQSGEAVAVVGWREQSLIVFFKNQIEEVVVDTTNPFNSVRRRLEGRYGCGARDSIVQVGDDIYFMDQYGSYRSLRRNELGSDQGIVSLPVSEIFREELPGNLNRQYLYRAQAALLEEFLYVCWPAAGSDTPNRMMVLDLGRETTTGPWTPAASISRFMTSDIEGRGFRLYSLSGDASSRVYRHFDGWYSDDGTAITYRQTSKAFDLGVPHVNKQAVWYDVEFIGEIGAVAVLQMRTNENDAWTSIAAKAVEPETAGLTFPLTDDDFPLTDASFPLTASDPKVTTMKGWIPETHTGDLPLYDQDLPLTNADLPLDSGGGLNHGRVIQWRVLNQDDGTYFEVVGVRIGVRVHNLELEDVP